MDSVSCGWGDGSGSGSGYGDGLLSFTLMSGFSSGGYFL